MTAGGGFFWLFAMLLTRCIAHQSERDKKKMNSLPVMVLFGLSFPPVFFVLLVSLALFYICIRLLQPTGIYDVVWHPALFNTALFCCLFYLLFRFGL